MEPLQEITVCCPYCGEDISVLADSSEGNQSYIEDCEVCCCPINIELKVSDDGECEVGVSDDL